MDAYIEERQAGAMRQLAAAVIGLAVQDASERFSPNEKKVGRNLSGEAISGLRFLFDTENRMLEFYAGILDMEPERIRNKLRESLPANAGVKAQQERRNLHLRLQNYETRMRLFGRA